MCSPPWRCGRASVVRGTLQDPLPNGLDVRRGEHAAERHLAAAEAGPRALELPDDVARVREPGVGAEYGRAFGARPIDEARVGGDGRGQVEALLYRRSRVTGREGAVRGEDGLDLPREAHGG